MHLLMYDSMAVYARAIEVKRGMRYRSRGGGVGTMKGSVIRQADRYDLAEDSHYAAVDL